MSSAGILPRVCSSLWGGSAAASARLVHSSLLAWRSRPFLGGGRLVCRPMSPALPAVVRSDVRVIPPRRGRTGGLKGGRSGPALPHGGKGQRPRPPGRLSGRGRVDAGALLVNAAAGVTRKDGRCGGSDRLVDVVSVRRGLVGRCGDPSGIGGVPRSGGGGVPRLPSSGSIKQPPRAG